jgi:hypothetical protein
MIFTRLRATQALPCSRTEFTAMSSPKAERVLFAACKVEASFLERRAHIIRHVPCMKQHNTSMNASWHVLTFISDRFLLSVDDSLVVIWDSSTLASSSSSGVASPPWAYFALTRFLGYTVYNSTLYIAIARVHVDHRRSVVSDTCRLAPDRAQCCHLFGSPPFIRGKRKVSRGLLLGSRVFVA